MPIFSRLDGDLVRDSPAYRRIMPFIMRGRNESAVLFEQRIDATAGLRVIKQWNDANPQKKISFMHLVTHALVLALHERPRLNRFVAGSHLYQRRGIWISYSGKKALNDDSPVVVFKREMTADQTFETRVDQLHGAVKESRSNEPSHVDKELGIFLKIPSPILRWGVKALFWLDRWNLLPHFFMRDDPMFASAFIANLGSIRLDAVFHHMYEYGNIPIFVTIGKLSDVPYAKPDGTVGVRTELMLRWNYDERTEDGLYCAQTLEKLRERLESPESWLNAIPP